MLDPIFTLVEHSGAVIVSDIIDGHRVSKTYYGYGITESMNLFKKEFGNIENVKPTREQFAAVEKVALAMYELSELWDENFNIVFEELGEEITGDLLTRSFDEMASAWLNFRYCVGNLTNANRSKNVSF
jgi:deoxyhypusine synthase